MVTRWQASTPITREMCCPCHVNSSLNSSRTVWTSSKNDWMCCRDTDCGGCVPATRPRGLARQSYAQSSRVEPRCARQACKSAIGARVVAACILIWAAFRALPLDCGQARCGKGRGPRYASPRCDCKFCARAQRGVAETCRTWNSPLQRAPLTHCALLSTAVTNCCAGRPSAGAIPASEQQHDYNAAECTRPGLQHGCSWDVENDGHGTY